MKHLGWLVALVLFMPPCPRRVIHRPVQSTAVQHRIDGDIDRLAFPKSSAFYLLTPKGIPLTDYAVVFEMKPLDLFIGFNKNTNNGLINALQTALDTMKFRGKDEDSV